MADTKLKLPEKRTMNLYQTDREMKRKEKTVKTLIIVLAVIFVLVAVVGRYALLFYKNVKLHNSEAELATLEEQLVDFDRIKLEYDKYARSYYTSDEAKLLNRSAFINIANSAVSGYGQVEYIAIDNNTCTVRVVVDNLDSVAAIKKNIEESSNVNGASITVADNNKKSSSSTNSGKVVANIYFTMGNQIEEG